MTDATLPAPLEYNPPAAARGSIVLLHGLGADGSDLYPLAAGIGGGEYRVVCPHAPVRPVTLNGGMQMRAWYDIVGTDLVDRQDRSGADEAAAQIEQLLAAEKAAGCAADRLYLAGFSQGAAMSLHVGLRHAEPLAGIIAMSGYLLFADALAQECRNTETPIFLAHGGMDMVVRTEWGHMTRDLLNNGGYNVSYREYPLLEHGIAPEEIDDLNRWLAE